MNPGGDKQDVDSFSRRKSRAEREGHAAIGGACDENLYHTKKRKQGKDFGSSFGCSADVTQHYAAASPKLQATNILCTGTQRGMWL
ncbi:hypothetical protein HZ326_2154 [Fusarium oxysporum f. sp. albedinis]|nr:hypothetical protein HZ326_2154 [Fusarium oxysporum f. sp. albedinis]